MSESAVVSREPATQAGQWLVRVARGSEGQVYGPFDEAEIATREGEVIAALEGEGFVQTPNGELLQRLAGASAKDRALAALRLGWRGAEEAIPRLIALTESPGEELCSVLDALGMIGNESAIAAVRPFAARKLLSRRRSAVEALIRLEDHETLAAVRDREHARLPLNVQEALAGEDGAAIADAVLSAEAKKRGVSLDVLYERNEAHCTAAVRRAVLKLDLTHPSIWRYAKSVFKRSMLRGDAKTFGLFAYRCERAGITGGAVHTVKSGYDGKSRPMPILSRKTSNKMRSAGWRYLRDVAQWRPEAYTLFASEVLLHYRDSDGIKPERRAGAFADCFYFNRILYGNGDRLEVDWRSLRHRFKNAQSVHPSGSREEPFAELWDSTPRPFLRLATRARHLEVQRFALAGLVRHPEVLHEATVEALLRLLNVPLPTAAPLVVAELERRFDPRAPDWSLVEILLGRDEEPVIELLIRWLDETRDQWCPVPERVARFLESKAVSVQRRVAAWVNEAPYPEGSAVPLMELLRAKLSGPESTEGSSAAIASVLAGALRSTLLAHTDLEFDLALIADGSPTVQALGGALLAERDGAYAALGIVRLVALADHSIVNVRRAALHLIRTHPDAWRQAPAPLFAVAESSWSDSRELAFELLRTEVDLEALGLDAAVRLCDSGTEAVRTFGREMLVRHFVAGVLDPDEVLFRLAEHPDRDMWRFTLELLENHLRPGLVPLARIERFFTGVLFDLWPRRDLKTRTLAFLEARALSDGNQADHVARILGRIVRTRTVSDFERVAQTLQRIQHAFPDVQTEMPPA